MKKSILLLVILLVPALLLMAHGEDSWDTPAEAKKVKNPEKATPESIANGKVIFEKSCVNCHGPKGEGDGKALASMKTKPHSFADPGTFKEQTDGQLFYKLSNKGQNPMPSFATKLTEKERWDLVNFLRTLAKAGAASHEHH